jgi:hypothetical protein
MCTCVKNLKLVTNFEFISRNKVLIWGFVMASMYYVHNVEYDRTSVVCTTYTTWSMIELA